MHVCHLAWAWLGPFSFAPEFLNPSLILVRRVFFHGNGRDSKLQRHRITGIETKEPLVIRTTVSLLLVCNCLVVKEHISLSIGSLPLPHLALGTRSLSSCWPMHANYVVPSRTQFVLWWNDMLMPSVQAAVGEQAWPAGGLALKGSCGSCDMFGET